MANINVTNHEWTRPVLGLVSGDGIIFEVGLLCTWWGSAIRVIEAAKMVQNSGRLPVTYSVIDSKEAVV